MKNLLSFRYSYNVDKNVFCAGNNTEWIRMGRVACIKQLKWISQIIIICRWNENKIVPSFIHLIWHVYD